MRSQLAADWLRDLGVPLPRLQGGSKALRPRALIELDRLELHDGLFVLYGRTGAGKTEFLKEVESKLSTSKFLDLEACARHRGSAFGLSLGDVQPHQVAFEYQLALRIRRAKLAEQTFSLQ